MKQPTRLAEIRSNKHLKHIDIAKAAGVSRAFYTQVENGVRVPSLKTAKPMADALGITLDEFFSALGVTVSNVSERSDSELDERDENPTDRLRR